jgi:glycosyltransferase involved in cell wall biosynthesis
MNVLLVCGAGIISGKETMALQLAEGLKEQRIDVECVTAFWGSREFRQRLHILQIPTHVLRLGFISATLKVSALYMTTVQLMFWPSLVASYSRFLRRFNPNKVVHTNWHHLLLLSPLLNSKRDLYWVHEIIPDKRQYRWVFSLLQRRLSSFVAVSKAVAHSLEKIGIPQDKIHIVYNGIIDPAPRGATHNNDQAGSRIGIVGQIGRWKGHDDLLEAFAQVAETYSGAELHIFGNGAEIYERELRGRARLLGIENQIFWHGFVADRTQVFRAIDVCVVPSRFEEPFGLVAVEAGFFGLPVVAARCGGLSEIVEDGRNGFLVAPGQPGEIANRLRALIKNPQLRYDMGKEGRCKALQNFSRTRFIQEFVPLLAP